MMRRLLGVGLGLMSSFAQGQASTDTLGMYAQAQFRTVQGDCPQCTALPQTLWYFRHETYAVPTNGLPVSRFDTSKRGAEDIEALNLEALPELIWTGSSQYWPRAVLNDAATEVKTAQDERFDIQLVPKIPSNRSYWNADTSHYFSQSTVSIRGESEGQTLVARTMWPHTFKLDLTASVQPLQSGESLQSLVQFANGGARSPYQSRLLWEKSPGVGQQSSGKTALGILLNGAQGDDDEAHGGHFALATGVVGEEGEYGTWLVNNYYNLATNSEKGIIAGVTPFDKYMADLNSGQAFYRPSYMLVAVFSQPDIPKQIQALNNRVMQHFYRNDLLYDHALENCAGISIDTLRHLGWQVPERGVESVLKASAAYWYVAATERSLQKGRAIYDYLNTEMTRLFPAVAFDAIGNDLLNIAYSGDHRTLASATMRAMPQQLEALYFVRIPQIPSSRAFGLAPVYSFAQYLQQAPADRSQWKIIPVTPNPLPEQLKDDLALKPQVPGLVPLTAILFLISVVLAVALMLWLFSKMYQILTARVKYASHTR
ncbi:hypothetical protein [Methylophilus sp. 3sh_L]|uniref:hypothetical protein n=1 Tax=Methylophilus sp. 3sh_L TaxID=3377114 RepID=UPI00398E7D24